MKTGINFNSILQLEGLKILGIGRDKFISIYIETHPLDVTYINEITEIKTFRDHSSFNLFLDDSSIQNLDAIAEYYHVKRSIILRAYILQLVESEFLKTLTKSILNQ